MKNINSKAGWIIAILVLINIATLVTIWHIFREHRPPQNGHDTAHFLIKELGFDSLQKEKYLLLVKQHQQDIQDIKEQAKESKEAFFFLLADTTISEDNIKARARTAFESEGEIAIKTFHHLQHHHLILIDWWEMVIGINISHQEMMDFHHHQTIIAHLDKICLFLDVQYEKQKNTLHTACCL